MIGAFVVLSDVALKYSKTSIMWKQRRFLEGQIRQFSIFIIIWSIIGGKGGVDNGTSYF
jgi:hypothetical protein